VLANRLDGRRAANLARQAQPRSTLHNARTRSALTFIVAMSVAVLSLYVIIASRIERAVVASARSRNTGLPTVHGVADWHLLILGQLGRPGTAQAAEQAWGLGALNSCDEFFRGVANTTVPHIFGIPAPEGPLGVLSY
jgi:hypothetical protein